MFCRLNPDIKIVVCCCHPVFSGRQTCRCTSQGHTGRPHRIYDPLFFCGACLNFHPEKDSAVPFFPSSIVKSNCAYPWINRPLLVGHYFLFYFIWWGKVPLRVTAPGFELTSQRQKVSMLPTEPPGRMIARTKQYSSQSTVIWQPYKRFKGSTVRQDGTVDILQY